MPYFVSVAGLTFIAPWRHANYAQQIQEDELDRARKTLEIHIKLTGKPELGRPRPLGGVKTFEDNIKLILKK